MGGAGVVVSRVGGFGDSVTEGGGDRDGEDVLPPMVASPCATFLSFMSVLLFFSIITTMPNLA